MFSFLSAIFVCLSLCLLSAEAVHPYKLAQQAIASEYFEEESVGLPDLEEFSPQENKLLENFLQDYPDVKFLPQVESDNQTYVIVEHYAYEFHAFRILAKLEPQFQQNSKPSMQYIAVDQTHTLFQSQDKAFCMSRFSDEELKQWYTVATQYFQHDIESLSIKGLGIYSVAVFPNNSISHTVISTADDRQQFCNNCNNCYKHPPQQTAKMLRRTTEEEDKADVQHKFPNSNITSTKTSSLPKQPHQPIAGFVSTSVLTSSDGLFGDNVEEKRIDESTSANNAPMYDSKSLYERLQEQKEQKDQAWKESHNPFAPPKGLDDEEMDFLNEVDQQAKQRDRLIEQETKKELAAFAVARAETSSNAIHEPKKTVTSVAPVKPTPTIALRAKAKIKPKSKTKTKHKIADGKVSVNEVSSVKSTGKSGMGGLVGYGSDDNSD